MHHGCLSHRPRLAAVPPLIDPRTHIPGHLLDSTFKALLFAVVFKEIEASACFILEPHTCFQIPVWRGKYSGTDELSTGRSTVCYPSSRVGSGIWHCLFQKSSQPYPEADQDRRSNKHDFEIHVDRPLLIQQGVPVYHATYSQSVVGPTRHTFSRALRASQSRGTAPKCPG